MPDSLSGQSSALLSGTCLCLALVAALFSCVWVWSTADTARQAWGRLSGHALDDGRGRRRALRREAVGILEILERLLELRLVVVMDHHQGLALLHLGADLLDLGHPDRVVDLVVGALLAGAKPVDRKSC